MSVILRIFCLLVFNVLCFSLIPSAYSTNLQDDTDLDSKQNQSFSQRTLASKYNLIEEDFDDVPRRETKFDFIKEESERLRPFSRPDGPEFAILNLQWKSGNIFINNFETVSGEFKRPRGFFGDKKNRFFYRLFSGDQKLVHEEQFEVPFTLHFDYMDKETGVLSGGALKRSDLDFAIKIPLSDKTANRVIFYKTKGPETFKARQNTGIEDDGSEEVFQETMLGETRF